MHKLSQKKIAFLKDRQLEMLCFAMYSIYLHFEDGTKITIEGDFRHIVGAARTQAREYSFPIATSELPRLVGTRVEAIELVAGGSLGLHFSNGDRLILSDGDQPYESYRIEHAGEEIVI